MSTTYLPHLAELRARRLIAQGLAHSAARPRWSDGSLAPTDVMQAMIAIQGQNYHSGAAAIVARGGGSTDDVAAAIASFDIVRAWTQRGTHHFVSAADARWMMRMTNPRIERAASRRRSGLGLEPHAIDVARQAFHEALRARGVGNPLTRTESYRVFADAGIDPSEGRGPHLLRALGGEGDVVQGPRIGSRAGDETFVLVDDLPTPSTEFSSDTERLRGLALRYVNSRGPVCVADLAWWMGLTKSEAKKALSLVADHTVPFVIESTRELSADYVMPTWQYDITPAELEAALAAKYRLPAFDEYLLGYGTRTEVLEESLRPQVLTKNGISWPFVVQHGVITGRDSRDGGTRANSAEN